MDKNNNSRRNFLKSAALASTAIGLGLASCAGGDDKGKTAGGSKRGKKIKWKATTTWPPNFPVLGEGMQLFADWVKTMSDGRLDIKVYGAGEYVPAMESFDAVSQGTVEIGHGAAYYWSGKMPAASFFASVPFGLNAQQINAWLLSGGGLALWEELYAPHNVIPFPAGNTGVQMGGWFNREVQTVADIKGLKMRIPGLGGKVIDKLGGSSVQIPGAEVYTSLERGVIDATEWIGPFHDYKLGLHKVAKFYYYPGWHEPGTTLEMIINKQAFEALPEDLQEIVRTAALRSNHWVLSELEAKNNQFLSKMVKEEGVQLRRFPDEVLQALKVASAEILSAEAAKDPFAKKVYEHMLNFKKEVLGWYDLSEGVMGPLLR
jgi:TRAP-type mannitol/chloroaromatic compound transport system substrate-binding protein